MKAFTPLRVGLCGLILVGSGGSWLLWWTSHNIVETPGMTVSYAVPVLPRLILLAGILLLLGLFIWALVAAISWVRRSVFSKFT